MVFMKSVFSLFFPPWHLFRNPFSAFFAPKDVIWPPLGPSWRHLGLLLGLLGATLAPLGLPLAVPWRPLEPILAIWDPQGTYWIDFSMNFNDFSWILVNILNIFCICFPNFFFDVCSSFLQYFQSLLAFPRHPCLRSTLQLRIQDSLGGMRGAIE